MSKKVAVLFSGGLDSTYLVYKNLKEGNTVYPVYIEITNNQVKSLIEKNRIELLRKEFLKEFKLPSHEYNEPISRINYLLNVGVVANESSLHLRQLPVWMLGLSFMQSMGVDEIQIGYVSNDDAISYLDEIQTIYKSYQLICEPMIPLVFPISKKHKFQMADELPHQYMKLIFSCENADLVNQKDRDKLGKMGETPTLTSNWDEVSELEKIEYEACCNCVPCRTIISTNYYGKGYFPDSYKKNLYDSAIRTLERAGFSVKDERKGTEFRKKTSQEEEDDYACAKALAPKPPRREYVQMEIPYDTAGAPDYKVDAYQEYLARVDAGEDERTAFHGARKIIMGKDKIVNCECKGDICDCKTKDISYLDDDEDLMVEKA